MVPCWTPLARSSSSVSFPFAIMKVLLLLPVAIALTSCSSGPSAFRFEASSVRVASIDDFALGYFLTHCVVEAESPLPHAAPAGHRFHYRILGATEQGNFVNGGPSSLVFVTIWNYADYPQDGHIRCFRIEGARFYEFIGVQEWKPEQSDGYFLSFRLASRPERHVKEILEVR